VPDVVILRGILPPIAADVRTRDLGITRGHRRRAVATAGRAVAAVAAVPIGRRQARIVVSAVAIRVAHSLHTAIDVPSRTRTVGPITTGDAALDRTVAVGLGGDAHPLAVTLLARIPTTLVRRVVDPFRGGVLSAGGAVGERYRSGARRQTGSSAGL